ncbi:hypothetical protein MMC28_005762 [Mycoblastus sanguinarius]|nr:hypothetical protein [Mycoblastus sanguinarius]
MSTSIDFPFAVSAFFQGSLATVLTSFQEASPTCCEPLQPSSNGWDEKALLHNFQGGREASFEIHSLRKQFRALDTQYQDVCAAYNQVRRDLDAQVQRTKSVDSILNMERNMRVETEIRCQILQHTVDTIKSSKREADKQKMATIAKLTDVLHASRAVDGNVGSGSRSR